MARAARKTDPPLTARGRQPGDREGVEGIEGLAQSFAWKERYTKAEIEMRAIFEALKKNPGRDARVGIRRKAGAAEQFAGELEAAHPELDVYVRGIEVYAMFPVEPEAELPPKQRAPAPPVEPAGPVVPVEDGGAA